MSKDIRKIWQEALPINKERLDEECVKQPVFYEQVGQALIRADIELKQAKAQVELIQAKLQLDIRKDPKKYEIEKITEATIESVVCSSEEYQQALTEALKAEEEYRSLSILLEAVGQRKSLIHDLVELYVHEYYGSGVGKISDEEMIAEVRNAKNKGNAGSS